MINLVSGGLRAVLVNPLTTISLWNCKTGLVMLTFITPEMAAIFDHAIRHGIGQGPLDLISLFVLSGISVLTAR